MNHVALRGQVCNYLELLPNIFGEFWEGKFDNYKQYLAKMREQNTWGEHLTLQAMANLMMRPIWVITDSAHEAASVIQINPIDAICPDKWDEPVYVVHYGERHYEATEPAPEAIT